MKITITISAEIDIDGSTPPNQWVEEQSVIAINDAMPSVLADSDDLDCILFVRSWETKSRVDA